MEARWPRLVRWATGTIPEPRGSLHHDGILQRGGVNRLDLCCRAAADYALRLVWIAFEAGFFGVPGALPRRFARS